MKYYKSILIILLSLIFIGCESKPKEKENLTILMHSDYQFIQEDIINTLTMFDLHIEMKKSKEIKNIFKNEKELQKYDIIFSDSILDLKLNQKNLNFQSLFYSPIAIGIQQNFKKTFLNQINIKELINFMKENKLLFSTYNINYYHQSLLFLINIIEEYNHNTIDMNFLKNQKTIDFLKEFYSYTEREYSNNFNYDYHNIIIDTEQKILQNNLQNKNKFSLHFFRKSSQLNYPIILNNQNKINVYQNLIQLFKSLPFQKKILENGFRTKEFELPIENQEIMKIWNNSYQKIPKFNWTKIPSLKILTNLKFYYKKYYSKPTKFYFLLDYSYNIQDKNLYINNFTENVFKNHLEKNIVHNINTQYNFILFNSNIKDDQIINNSKILKKFFQQSEFNGGANIYKTLEYSIQKFCYHHNDNYKNVIILYTESINQNSHFLKNVYPLYMDCKQKVPIYVLYNHNAKLYELEQIVQMSKNEIYHLKDDSLEKTVLKIFSLN